MNDPQSFTQQQLATARAVQWHQKGEPIQTLEAMQDWLSAVGLVLWTPRPVQMPAPAPSFAEAAYGSTTPDINLVQMEPAQNLLNRLIDQNFAVALNLLGTLGDTPDFIVSTQVLPYVFTLRGDKNWKQAPSNSGPAKVSPLAVKVYELLAEHGALNTRDLITHAGREVTEAAILRAVGELWSQLRVFPRPQNNAQSLWEISTVRFTKQIKAGSNAGVPSALSALITLYLGSVIAATSEEIEVFLSPVASRSRIREVINALSTGRQLMTTVVDGKSFLHLEDSLPQFEAPAVAFDPDAPRANPEDLRSETEVPAPLPDRIKKFTPRTGGTDSRERRPFNREAREKSGKTFSSEGRPPRKSFGDKPFGAKKPSGAKPFGDRPPRPRRDGDGGTRPSPRKSFGGDAGKPDYTKPWEEERKARPQFDGSDAPDAAAEPSSHAKPRFPRFDDKDRSSTGPRSPRKTFGDRPRPSFDRGGDSRPPRKSFGDKPSFPRKSFGDRPSGDRPRPSFGGGEGRPPRKSFGDKPSFPRKSFDGDSRPPRKPYGDRPSGDRPRPSFSGGEGGPPRKSFGDKPSFPRKSFGDKPSFSREGGERPRRSPDGDSRPPRNFDRVGGDKKPGSFGPRKPGSFSAKPGGFGPKKFGAKPGGGFGGPKKFGGASKFGGPKKFGGKPGGAGPRKPRKEGRSE